MVLDSCSINNINASQHLMLELCNMNEHFVPYCLSKTLQNFQKKDWNYFINYLLIILVNHNKVHKRNILIAIRNMHTQEINPPVSHIGWLLITKVFWCRHKHAGCTRSWQQASLCETWRDKIINVQN